MQIILIKIAIFELSIIAMNYFNIAFKNIDKAYTFFFDQTTLNNEELFANIEFNTPTLAQRWVVKGSLSTADMNSDVKLYAKDKSKMILITDFSF